MIGASWGVDCCVVGLDRNWPIIPRADGEAVGFFLDPRRAAPGFKSPLNSYRIRVHARNLFLYCSHCSDSLSAGCTRWGGVHDPGCSGCIACGPLPQGFSCSRQARRRRRTAARTSRAFRLLLCSLVVVAVVLRGGAERFRRGRAQPAMRAAAVFIRGAWPVAAIREGLPGILPSAGAAARPQHRVVDARPDAGAAADLQRMGPARRLFRAERARLFRDRAQGAGDGENPAAFIELERRSRSRPTRSRTLLSRPIRALTRDGIAVSCGASG